MFIHFLLSVAVGTKIYFFGGMFCDPPNENCTLYSDFFVFNLQNNVGEFLSLDPSPEARVFHSAVYCEPMNIMVIFGGAASESLKNDVWIYDIGSYNWYQPPVAGTPPIARMSHVGITGTH